MLEAFAIAWRTQRISLLASSKTRRGLILYALALALGLVLTLFVGNADGESVQRMILTYLLPLLSLLMAESITREGMTQRTLLYPLLGPVPRGVLAGARLLVMVALTFMLLALPMLLLGWEGLRAALWALLALGLGAYFYIGLAALVHGFTRRGLIAGLAFFWIFDLQLARIPLGLRQLAPLSHVWTVAGLDKLPNPFGLPLAAPESSLAFSMLYLFGLGSVFTLLSVAHFSRLELGELC